MREVNFEPSIPQPPSSQLTLSALDKTVIHSKNLILQYETDIEKLQLGNDKMSKESIASEEKRKVRLIELETRKLNVYTEMQQDERNSRLEALMKEKQEREAEREKRKYKEYNERRQQEEQEEAKEESKTKGLLNKVT